MKKKLANTWKKKRYWSFQIDGNKFATGQILEKPVEVVKGWILAGWAQKYPEPWWRKLYSEERGSYLHPYCRMKDDKCLFIQF